MDQPAITRPAVFVARGLSKTYASGERVIYALRELDLDIYEGQFSSSGPSGSGKSTLLNISWRTRHPDVRKSYLAGP